MRPLQVYVMQQSCMDEGYPWPNIATHVRPHIPYHYQNYVIASLAGTSAIGDMRTYETEEGLIEALIGIHRRHNTDPIRPKVELILGRHPVFPAYVNIQGDVEKHRRAESTTILQALKGAQVPYRIEYENFIDALAARMSGR